MSDPFWNLWGLTGTLFIASGLAFLVWLLGGVSFKLVVLIVILLFAAAFFANIGDG
jgi:hypothetical protein